MSDLITAPESEPAMGFTAWPGSGMSSRGEIQQELAAWESALAAMLEIPHQPTAMFIDEHRYVIIYDPSAPMSGFYKNLVEPRVSLRSSVSEQNTFVALLVSAGQDAVAERVLKLFRIVDEDPEKHPVETESLRNFTAFFSTYLDLGVPAVGVDGEGSIQAEWRTAERGVVVMVFLPDGRVRYAGVAGLNPANTIRVRGTVHREDVLEQLRELPAPFGS